MYRAFEIHNFSFDLSIEKHPSNVNTWVCFIVQINSVGVQAKNENIVWIINSIIQKKNNEIFT